MPLYTSKALKEDDHYCHPSDKSAWFFESVRQIRMQARQMERQTYQYGWTLAAVLLRKAANPAKLVELDIPKGLSREEVRAMAFVLAEKIILHLTDISAS